MILYLPVCALALSGLNQPTTPEPAPNEPAPSVGLILSDPQDTLDNEERITELELRLEALAAELERTDLGAVAVGVDSGVFGLAPGASKIYATDENKVSIGGYGETLFQFRPGDTDVFDALRTVFYIGYKFNEQWLLNTEIEFEHGSTSSSSGTTSSGGSASAEFAYIDYLYSQEHLARIGLVLVPMGWVNELHEPTTYMTARRSVTETRIIPTTWRELGAGVAGETEDWAYRAYVLNGLDGSDFNDDGLRGGRQSGNRAAAEDLALVARLDWTGTPGLVVGASAYTGDAGQDQAAGGADLGTTIFDIHAEYRYAGWRARGLFAMAEIDDADEFNTGVVAGGGTNPGLAEELDGGYLELGYNLFAGRDTEQALTPFVRYETIDTQAKLPASAGPAQGIVDDIFTFGIGWNPTSNLIFKIDYEDWDDSNDVWNIQVGYVF